MSSSRRAIHDDGSKEESKQKVSLPLRQCGTTFLGTSPELLVVCYLLPQTG